MKLDFEDYILDIAEVVSSGLGNVLDVSTTRWIARPDGKELIADATMAFMINGKKFSDDVVLLVSNSRFPNVVKDDLARARSVAGLVDQDVRKHIIKPLSEGTFGTQTYAAFPKLDPISGNRFVRQSQKYIAAPKITSWCASLALQTQTRHSDTASYEKYFVEPLEWICTDPQCSQRLRDFAAVCLDNLNKSQRDLWTAVQHEDFWIGNVLFERKQFPRFGFIPGDFTVIDWRGSRNDGYPCVDIIRFLSSIYRKGSGRVDFLLREYRKSLKISEFEMALYSALGMGCLGKNLDQFPRERYNKLFERMLDFLHSHRLIQPI